MALLRFLLAIALAAGSIQSAAARGLIRDAEIERTLAMLSLPIYEAAGVEPDSIEMFIVNDDSMNAFVAGGRNIFLHTGLLRRLQTPSELQGVIAHELGHITGGHLARRNIKLRNAQGPALIGQFIGIAAGVAGGVEVGTAIAAGSQGALVRDVLRHSRSEEGSADQAALTYLEEAGIDPSGLQRVFSRYRGQESLTAGQIDPYAITHPFFKQRMQLVERRVRNSRHRGVPPPPEHVYWHARMRAKIDGFLNDPQALLARLENRAETEFTLYAKSAALHRTAAVQDAVAAVDRLIAMRPDDPYYNELKGQILFEFGRAGDAIAPYRRATELAPDEPLLKAGLGRALLALDTGAADAEALSVLREARRADIADAATMRALAEAYARAGDDGMASLSTAERLALQGNERDAVLHARRAARLLAEGSPGWLRARDILRLSQDE